MATKAESIAHGNINFFFYRMVESEIKATVDFFIISKMIDGWRNNVVDNSVYSGNSLYHER